MPLSQETINEQLALLATHRRTLAHLVQQAAEYGSEVFAPPQTASGISKARTEIRRIKAILRAEGVTVTDEPNETSSAYDTEPEALSKPTTSVRLKVFLCHSKIDKLNVRNLYQRLRADGFQPWLDEEELIGGQDWDAEIAQAVRESDVVLVCLSQNASNRTGYIHREIEYALDIADRQPKGTIFIIPLRLEECDVPQRLSRWHWINLFEERGYARLVQSLRHRATAKQNSSINLDELRNGRAWVSLPSQRPQQVPALQEPPPFQSRKRKDFGGSTTLQTSRAEGDYVTRANLEKNPVDNQPSVSRVSSFLYELRKRIVQSGEVSRGVSPSKKKSIYSFLKETILNVSFGERLLKIISSISSIANYLNGFIFIITIVYAIMIYTYSSTSNQPNLSMPRPTISPKPTLQPTITPSITPLATSTIQSTPSTANVSPTPSFIINSARISIDRLVIYKNAFRKRGEEIGTLRDGDIVIVCNTNIAEGSYQIAYESCNTSIGWINQNYADIVTPTPTQ